MEFTIGQIITHKTLGNGEITDIYERDNGNEYIDIHFDIDNNRYHGKYIVHTFTKESLTPFLM